MYSFSAKKKNRKNCFQNEFVLCVAWVILKFRHNSCACRDQLGLELRYANARQITAIGQILFQTWKRLLLENLKTLSFKRLHILFFIYCTIAYNNSVIIFHVRCH